jgi:hypothetical protein
MPRRLPSLCLAAGLALAATAWAGEPVRKGSLEFAEPWARATAPRQANGAAYLTIRNSGATADRIVAAKAAVSRKVELHTHVIDARGVAQMREVPAIEVPADSTLRLEPGGLHVMFIGLERPLEAGKRFPLTLVLEKAGEVALEVEVRATSGAAPMQHGTGHGGHGTSN